MSTTQAPTDHEPSTSATPTGTLPRPTPAGSANVPEGVRRWKWRTILILAAVSASVFGGVWSLLDGKKPAAPTAPNASVQGQAYTPSVPSAAQPAYETPKIDVSGTLLCKGYSVPIKTLAPKGGDNFAVVRVPKGTTVYWFRTDKPKPEAIDTSEVSICDAFNDGNCLATGKPLTGSMPRHRAENQTTSPIPISCEYEPES